MLIRITEDLILVPLLHIKFRTLTLILTGAGDNVKSYIVSGKSVPVSIGGEYEYETILYKASTKSRSKV